MSSKPTQKPEWKALQAHHDTIHDQHMRAMFEADPARFDKFHIRQNGLLFDYSKHRITEETLGLLISLAKSCDVEGARQKMFGGDKINVSENRAALHTALRGSTDQEKSFVSNTLARIQKISTAIREEKKFTDIVSIGIGGSDLGTRLACDSLHALCDGPRVHFLANIDGAEISELLEKLKPETTLFVVISKTFTTQETLTNAKTARAWITDSAQEIADHFIAVTADTDKAEKFGAKPENILPLKDWVGGRYSLWSAAGLPFAIAAGFDQFENLLKGAKEIDEHFLSAPLDKNIPVIMAMLSVWYRNFFDFTAHAVLPYAENLKQLPAYLQQLDMESCGKSVSLDGEPLDHQTGSAVFGDVGTNAQHAFMQLLHQGSEIIPCDFIVPAKADHDLKNHHTKLLANALAQSKALMEGSENASEPHRDFAGNRPSSTIISERLDAYNLGMLLALYEHKVFVQGVIWDINVFDQWGVELGKALADNIEGALINSKGLKSLDISTQNLIKHIKV